MTFIDGHNVLHAIPELRELLNRDLVSAMQRLVGVVLSEKDTIVVFDGNPPPPFTNSHRAIVFANSSREKYERADQYILEHIRHRKQISVVTNDAALASTVRQLGGKIISPGDWFRNSGTQKTSISRSLSNCASDKKVGPGGTQSEWVELFRKGKPDK